MLLHQLTQVEDFQVWEQDLVYHLIGPQLTRLYLDLELSIEDSDESFNINTLS